MRKRGEHCAELNPRRTQPTKHARTVPKIFIQCDFPDGTVTTALLEIRESATFAGHSGADELELVCKITIRTDGQILYIFFRE